jgi:hypothetical protein
MDIAGGDNVIHRSNEDLEIILVLNVAREGQGRYAEAGVKLDCW